MDSDERCERKEALSSRLEKWEMAFLQLANRRCSIGYLSFADIDDTDHTGNYPDYTDQEPFSGFLSEYMILV